MSFPFGRMPQPGRPFRVLVIGGGFAGLSAARSLTSQAGDAMQVTVLEAGQTVGGRCRTGKVGEVSLQQTRGLIASPQGWHGRFG